MKFATDLLLAALLATSAVAAPLNAVIEMKARDLDLKAPEPEGYPSRNAPNVDSTATRSSWKREAEAEAVKNPEPEGYASRNGPSVDSTATRSSWKRGAEIEAKARN